MATSPLNVYVSGVPTSLDEGGLQKIFAKFGAIKSCRILRDTLTQQPRGVGFVNFERHEDAAEAIRQLNGQKVDEFPQPIQVKFANLRPATADSSDYGPSKSKSGTNNRFHPFATMGGDETSDAVYVCGFPKNWTKPQLEEMFAAFGTLLSVKVLVDPATNQGRGIGFIRFNDYENAAKSIEALNGKTVDGGNQPLQVRFARERKKTDTTPAIVTSAATYSQGFDVAQTTASYPSAFSYYYGAQAGDSGTFGTSTATDPSSAYYAYTDPTSGQAYYMQYPTQTTPTTSTPAYGGFTPGAFPPYFGQTSAATSTTPAYPPFPAPTTTGTTGYPYTGYGEYPTPTQGFGLDQAGLLPGPVLPGPGGGAPIPLFVLHIPADMKDADLRTLFSECGTVLNAKIMTDPATGLSKGFGFVNMSTLAEAQTAITRLDGYNVPNTNKYLKVSFKTTKQTK